MTDSLRTRIAAVLTEVANGRALYQMTNADATVMAEEVIRELNDNGWQIVPPEVTVFTGEYIHDGSGQMMKVNGGPARWSDNVGCNPHPDAPHGFDRNASHTEDRYVCDCEYWTPPNPNRMGDR